MRLMHVQCWKVKEVDDLMIGESETEAPVNIGRNYNIPKIASSSEEIESKGIEKFCVLL